MPNTNAFTRCQHKYRPDAKHLVHRHSLEGQLYQHDIDGLQHKGTMSTKPVFNKIAKIQRFMSHYTDTMTLMLLTLALHMTIIDKITTFCNYINKTTTSIELLATNSNVKTSYSTQLKDVT